MMSNTEENPTTEVHVSRKRRTYSEAYKARIVDQVDACSVLGDKGELLRREGLYYSTISRWRRQMAKKTRAKRGRPKKTPVQVENEEIKRQLKDLRARLERAEAIIDVQKKPSCPRSRDGVGRRCGHPRPDVNQRRGAGRSGARWPIC